MAPMMIAVLVLLNLWLLSLDMLLHGTASLTLIMSIMMSLIQQAEIGLILIPTSHLAIDQ